MCRVADTGAGYEAQCDSPYCRVVVELSDIAEVTLECLKVECLVELVQL